MIYDYIIIGSGAGGSAAAYRLARAEKQVLLIEKGPVLPGDGSTLDVVKVIGAGLFKSKEPWLDKNDKRFIPEEFFNLGGKTKWYGAALLRFDPMEFKAEPEFKCLGWPIAYRDLEPFYREAESLLGVRTFEAEPDLHVLLGKIKRHNAGWLSQPLPLALKPDIVLNEQEARHFDGFASVRGLKADGQNALLNRIADNQNFTLITGQAVRQLVGDESDPLRIRGVLLENGQRYSAGCVLLAAGALHSPRMLQDYLDVRGITAALPGAGSVGRYFKRHLLTAMLALSPSKKTDLIRKTVYWVNDRFSHSSIQPLGFSDDALTALMPALIPRWLARRLAVRAYGFFLQTEDGSDAGNRVSSAGQGVDSRQPKLDYDERRFPLLASEHKQMIKSFRRTLRRAGCISFIKRIPLAGTAHACGTLVTGNDPQQTVVDRNGKVHGLQNLYVVDGSILPRSSRVNPALTIYAWALRTADQLINGVAA